MLIATGKMKSVYGLTGLRNPRVAENDVDSLDVEIQGTLFIREQSILYIYRRTKSRPLGFINCIN